MPKELRGFQKENQFGKLNKGKKFTEEHRKKISEVLKKQWKLGKRKYHLSGYKFKKGHKIWLGKKHSEETKRKISQDKERARKISQTLKGKPKSILHRMKVIKILKEMNKDWIGKNNPHWKGGLTKFEYNLRRCERYKIWQSDVFERDNWTCQTCGKRGGGELNAHHIKEFNQILKENNIRNWKKTIKCKPLWDLNNGITLCEKCHKIIHRKKQ